MSSEEMHDVKSDDLEIEYIEYVYEEPVILQADPAQYSSLSLADPLMSNMDVQNTIIVYDTADVKDDVSLCTEVAGARSREVRRGGRRGRGARTRGGRSAPQRPDMLNNNLIYVGQVEDLREEPPLEVPLTPPKRRRDPPTGPPQPSNVWHSLDFAGPSNVRVDVKKKPKNKMKVPNADSPKSKVSVKGTATRTAAGQKCGQKAKQMKSKDVFECGSEDEDDDEGEDICIAVPRTLSMFFEPDEDMDQDFVEAGQLQDNEVDSDDDVQYGPTTLFDFKWKPFPTEPVPPRQRREVFRSRCSPTIESTLNPCEIFTKIWDHSIMEHIVEQTNLYAQQHAAEMLDSAAMTPYSRINRWVDTNVKELYVYFGLILAMGVVVKAKIEEYWSTKDNIFLTHKFGTYMTLSRFQLLSKCLHFNDNSGLSPELSPSKTKIYKLAPVIDHLNARFASLYNLSQNVALDESLTQWKGWLKMNQYIPNKKAAVGIKTYEVCDSRTGYLWRFEVHTGALTPDGDIISGGIPNLVLRLLRGLEHSGRTIWMDNYYNSPSLARVLKTLGLDCVGTLRINRPFVPKQIAALKKENMIPGQVCGCTSGDVDLVVWKDQNRVAMISTYHGVAGSSHKPNVVKDYNVCMGGVDRKDQMLSGYPIERKRTQVWYKKFFRRLLNVSVLNAYIIYKHFHPKTEHRSFRESLIVTLLDTNKTRLKKPRKRPVRVFCSPDFSGPKLSPEVLSHFPSELPFLPGGGKLKRLCVFCKVKRSFHFCKTCNVTLCFGRDQHCYLQYHS